MKIKVLVAGTVSLLLASTAPAQPAYQPEFTAEAFRAHVAFLADDLVEGREPGTRGYDIAARYVAAQFEALGLRPAAGGSWYQPVEFVRYSVPEGARISVGATTFNHGRELVFRPAADTEALNVEAPLVFVGYGLDAPPQGFNDYDGLDVRGKVVVALNGTPEGVPSDVAAHLQSDKRAIAARRGAVGFIQIMRRQDMEGLQWPQLAATAGRRDTSWVGTDGMPFDTAPGLRFAATVDATVAEILFRGAPLSLEQVMDAAARAGERPRGFALVETVRVERPSATLERFTSSNVVAVLPGSDPGLADEYVAITAHLDHFGVREGEGDQTRNGALDNATGVATLIEVARQMVQSGQRPRRPLLLAAVTAEELGLLGAEYLARHPVVDGRIVSLVNLDMPILTYDFQDVIAFGAEHSTMGPIVERAAARMDVRLTPDPLPQEGLFTRSDHYKFVREGVPSVFLMTGFAGEGRERFTHFLRTHYHTVDDDLDLPIDWQAGAKFAQLNYLIAREIADGREAPRWYSGSFFGDVFGGDQQRAERPAGGAQAAARQSE
jgi:hypothetical protein